MPPACRLCAAGSRCGWHPWPSWPGAAHTDVLPLHSYSLACPSMCLRNCSLLDNVEVRLAETQSFHCWRP